MTDAARGEEFPDENGKRLPATTQSHGNSAADEGGLDLVITGGRIPVGDRLEAAAIGIRDERVAMIGSDADLSQIARKRIDARGLWILPGAIDGHTHMEAPAFGLLSSDSFECGTAAAAAGGVTSIIDFTLGMSGGSLRRQIEARMEQACRAVVDVGLHAEIVKKEQTSHEQLRAAIDAGVTSFKHYMVYEERIDHGTMIESFRAIANLGATAMVHAEDAEIVEASTKRVQGQRLMDMMSLPRSRPEASEVVAVSVVVALAELTGARVHVAHVSTAGAVRVIAAAKKRGVTVSAETCPHYLLLSEKEYRSDRGRQFSVVPPLRRPADNDALWTALSTGTIDTVATDHCPFPRSAKDAPTDPLRVPCGLAGVETFVPIVFNYGVKQSRMSLSRFTSCISGRPAELFGLRPSKGGVQVGADADLMLFDPEAEWTIRGKSLHMSTGFSPFEGHKVFGKVRSTLVRGRPVFLDGELVSAPGWGRFVRCRPHPARSGKEAC